MRKVKTRYFSRWARKSRIADELLLAAAMELEAGLFAANLGGNLYKVRLAGQSSGKSSGYRTLLRIEKGIAFFSYMVSQKMNETISMPRNLIS
jgi:hypothetical protein